MKLIKKRIVIIALSFALAACLAATFIGVGNKTVLATQVSPTQPISQSYALGETLAPSDAKITYKGVEYDATVVSVRFPNGKAYKTDSYVLSVPGEYTINYSAVAGGITVQASVIFNVSGSAYEVGGSNSSASYATIDNTDDLGNPNGQTTSGLMVKLAFGDKFTYKKPINLNGKTKNDKLVEFLVVPKSLGKADARVLKLRLTDAYDPDNYVDIVTYGNYGDEDEVKLKAGEIANPGNPGWALYSAAAAVGQPLTGIHYKAPLENSSSAINYLDGRYAPVSNVVYNSANGYPSYDFSLVARNGYGKGLYSIAMDYAEKRVYGPKPASSLSNGIIVDLDEPLFFENLWKGFTTGEVYLSIWADSYVSSTFDFIIQNIDGQSLENPYYVDEASPIIDVEIPASGVPNAVVGQKYKLFNAFANDAVDGKLNVSTYVYKNYYSSMPISVKINDGAFTPDKASTYTIVYKAVDSAGNVGLKLVDVNSIAQSTLALTLNGGDQTATAGVPFVLKTPLVSGAIGDYTVKVNASVNGQSSLVMPNENGEYVFLPMCSGNYTIEYSCEDYNVSVLDSYSITVSENSTPVIIDEVYLPPVFVNEVEYVFPDFNGYDFSLGTPVLKKADVKYAFDDGEFTTYTSGQKVKINATQSVKVEYSVGDSEASKKTYVVPVKDVSGTRLNGSKTQFNIKNYFYGDYFTNFTVEEENGVNYKTTQDNSSLIFVNKLLASQFSVIFTVKEYAAEKILFTLTDSTVKSQALTLELKAIDQNSISISVSGGEQKTIALPLVDKQFKLEYDMLKNQFKFGGVLLSVEQFEGFSSKLVYFDIKIEGNQGSTTVNFEELNGQTITDAYNEYSKPKYYLVMNSNQKAVGDKLVISEFVAQDVISFETQIKLSLKDAEGNPLTATDGTVMNNVSDFSKDYEIVFEKVGAYSLTYNVSDGYNTEKKTITIHVKDSVPPQITIINPITLAKVGSNVSVANYQVVDPTDEKVSVRVCVQRPDMSVVNISGKSFKADIKGTYTVMYFAADATGNSAFAYYEVVVK